MEILFLFSPMSKADVCQCVYTTPAMLSYIIIIIRHYDDSFGGVVVGVSTSS